MKPRLKSIILLALIILFSHFPILKVQSQVATKPFIKVAKKQLQLLAPKNIKTGSFIQLITGHVLPYIFAYGGASLYPWYTDGQYVISKGKGWNAQQVFDILRSGIKVPVNVASFEKMYRWAADELVLAMVRLQKKCTKEEQLKLAFLGVVYVMFGAQDLLFRESTTRNLTIANPIIAANKAHPSSIEGYHEISSFIWSLLDKDTMAELVGEREAIFIEKLVNALRSEVEKGDNLFYRMMSECMDRFCDACIYYFNNRSSLKNSPHRYPGQYYGDILASLFALYQGLIVKLGIMTPDQANGLRLKKIANVKSIFKTAPWELIVETGTETQ